MKRIAIFLTVLSLVIIAFVQFMNWRKFSYDLSYDYPISKDIDTQYYDPDVVRRYYESAYRVGSFAREVWFNKRIDVKRPEEGNPESQAAAATYQQMLVSTKMLEDRLVYSKTLKDKGFDDAAIRYIEENNITPEQYAYHKAFKGKILKRGEIDQTVWYMQQIFNRLGKTIKVDGNFNSETEQAVKEFQSENGIYPSGIADQETLSLLLQKIKNK